MRAIIDYRIRLDDIPLKGTVEYSGDLLPKPGDRYILSIDDRRVESLVAEVGELTPRKGRLHVEMKFRDYPDRGLRRAIQRLASSLKRR